MAEKEAEETPVQPADGSKKKKMILGVVGLVVLLAGGGGAFFMLKGSAPATPQPQAGEHGESPSGEGEKKEGHGGGEVDKKEGGAPTEGEGKEGKKSEGKNSEGHGGGEGKQEEAGGHGAAKVEGGEAKGAGGKDKKKDSEGPSINFGATYGFKPFHINLGNPLENHYIRLEVAVEYKGGNDQMQEIEARKVQLRDAIIAVITRKTREFLLGPDGKDQLRLEMLNRINQYMERKIEAIYITDLLIE